MLEKPNNARIAALASAWGKSASVTVASGAIFSAPVFSERDQSGKTTLAALTCALSGGSLPRTRRSGVRRGVIG